MIATFEGLPHQGSGWPYKVPQTLSGPLLLSDHSTSEAHRQRRYFRLTTSDRFLNYTSADDGNDAEDQHTDPTLFDFLCGKTEERNDLNHDIYHLGFHMQRWRDGRVNFQPGEKALRWDQEEQRPKEERQHPQR